MTACAPAAIALAMSPEKRMPPSRSEEHTSELQSQSNLVCRLLLEKKKQETPLRLDGDVVGHRVVGLPPPLNAQLGGAAERRTTVPHGPQRRTCASPVSSALTDTNA